MLIKATEGKGLSWLIIDRLFDFLHNSGRLDLNGLCLLLRFFFLLGVKFTFEFQATSLWLFLGNRLTITRFRYVSCFLGFLFNFLIDLNFQISLLLVEQ